MRIEPGRQPLTERIRVDSRRFAGGEAAPRADRKAKPELPAMDDEQLAGLAIVRSEPSDPAEGGVVCILSLPTLVERYGLYVCGPDSLRPIASTNAFRPRG